MCVSGDIQLEDKERLRKRTRIDEAAQTVDDCALVVHAAVAVETEADARSSEASRVREPHEAPPDQTKRPEEKQQDAPHEHHEGADERERLRRRERLPERAHAAVGERREPRDTPAHQRRPRVRRGDRLRVTSARRRVQWRASAERQLLRRRPRELYARRVEATGVALHVAAGDAD